MNEQTTTQRVNPVKISIAYDWNSQNDNWGALSKHIRGLAENISAASNVPVYVNRLRAGVGGFVFHSIRKRLIESDILIFDLTAQNLNVVFELGMALMHNKGDTTNILVLCEEGSIKSVYELFNQKQLPSDIQGMLINQYREDGEKLKFQDSSFSTMLQSLIRHAVLERAGAPAVGGVKIEDDEIEGDEI